MFNFFKKESNYLFYLSVIAFITLLYFVKSILLPFILGIIIAYFFKNLVAKLEHKMSRHNLSIIITIFCFIIIFIFILVVIPVFVAQIINLIKYLMTSFGTIDIKAVIEQKYILLSESNEFLQSVEIKNLIQNMTKYLYDNTLTYLGNVSNYLLSYSLQFINFMVMIVISPIIAFYFLRDWDLIICTLKYVTPANIRKDTVVLFTKIDNVLQGYLISQFLVCFIFAIYYSLLLYLSGLKYGFAIGLLTGALTFLPFIGSIGCGTVAFFVSAVQYNLDIKRLAVVIIIYCLGSFLEGNFITPNLVGDKIKIHPLWIMFALFAGGVMFGFIGILLSMPVAGIIGVVVRFYLNKRKKMLCLLPQK